MSERYKQKEGMGQNDWKMELVMDDKHRGRSWGSVWPDLGVFGLPALELLERAARRRLLPGEALRF